MQSKLINLATAYPVLQLLTWFLKPIGPRENINKLKKKYKMKTVKGENK